MGEVIWHCVRQRAGPFVKECRALRPRLLRTDSIEDRRDKQQIVCSPHTDGPAGTAAGIVRLSGQPLHIDIR